MNYKTILQNIQRQKSYFPPEAKPERKTKNTRVIAYLYFHSRNAQLQTNINCTQHDTMTTPSPPDHLHAEAKV